MAESGCWQVSIGIESGNQTTIDGIGKHFTLDQLSDSLGLLRGYDIKVQGLFMLFNVWEEGELLRYENSALSRHTLEYAAELVRKGLLQYTGNFNVATPYPGSQLYHIANRHGLIKPEVATTWDAWLVDEPIVMSLPGVDEPDQIRLMRAGSLLISRCLWQQGQISFRDFPIYALRGVKTFLAELNSRRRATTECAPAPRQG
jgi:radical SAM superfamily enzyme YgiQ (UPF0313 family)